MQIDGAENLVMIPLSPRPQPEPGSSLFISRVCSYVAPVVLCVCVALSGLCCGTRDMCCVMGAFHHSTQTLAVGSGALELSCPVGS